MVQHSAQHLPLGRGDVISIIVIIPVRARREPLVVHGASSARKKEENPDLSWTVAGSKLTRESPIATMTAPQNSSWGFLLRVAETTPAVEGPAPTGVAPWVDDTGYFHWTPGREAHGLPCGATESSDAGASSGDRKTGRFRFWACTAVLLIGAVLLAATICLAASSNWMLLASAVRDTGTASSGGGGVVVETTTTGHHATGTYRRGGLMFLHHDVKVDDPHDRKHVANRERSPRTAGHQRLGRVARFQVCL
ncbi:hypothetical protein HPB52_018117 [Rhipicephalus sanguineus]|uniref:Uncharacterized protein n=1 Tax=Rhipicephalus sanguineus TaxID=34632 RepID=A0A9D4PL59_RHISA|nr:hypothetical protein HPB52_018117 [Rhipicephalus sanguineus]